MPLPKPYAEWPGVGTLFCGDCLEILPQLEAGSVDAVVTDPIWPNAPDGMFPGVEPFALFRDAMHRLPEVKRIGVQIGCNSDPRILCGIPRSFPFVRVCSLEYTQPGNVGRVLYTGDMAYLFGSAPAPREGQFLISGLCRLVNSHRERFEHPCYRQLQHVEWTVNKFTNPGESALDPFLGSGTTAVACIRTGRRFIGIELEPKYCAIAKARIDRELAQPRLPFVEPVKETQAELFAETEATETGE